MQENKESIHVSDSLALMKLESGYGQAEKMLQNPDKLEELFQKVEQKLKVIPVVGEKLAVAASMASLVKSYIKKEFTMVPIGTIIAIISALLYLVSPIDLIPDTIPIVGHSDDVGIVTVCLKLVESDLEEYLKWRKEQGRDLFPE